MPSVKARAFQVTFEKTLAKGGRLSKADVDALEAVANGIKDHKEKGAAHDVLALVRHDRVLDQSEVEPARKALCRLLGVSSSRLPATLEKVLTHAVPVPNVRVRSYDLSFDFSKDVPTFPARAIIELEDKAGATSILEIDPERLEIEEVKALGRRVPFAVKDGRLVVEAAGARRLDIRYRVKPTEDVTGYGLIRDRFAGRMWTLTWPYNTGALFPSSSRPSDGATARVTVHVKEGEQVVGPGKRDARGAYHLDEPVPAYAVAFTTGRFTDNGRTVRGGYEARTIGLGSKLSTSVRKDVRTSVAESMEFFSSWLGPYPFGKTLNIVEIKSEYGGMEHAGAVAVAVGQSRADTVEAAVHETAHHWFGDGIHIGHWGELWMSEGFTNYATFRFFRARDGETAFHGYLDAAKDALREQLEDKKIQPLAAAASVDPQEGLSWTPYMQGAWMLRMLEVQTGTLKMDSLLKTWFQDKQGQSVTTGDFIAFAAERHGLKLQPFFDAWARLEKIPTFHDASKIRGNAVALHLKPKGPVPEGMVIPVLLEGDNGKSRRFLVKPGEPLAVDAGFPVRSLSWDPQRTVLCDVVG